MTHLGPENNQYTIKWGEIKTLVLIFCWGTDYDFNIFMEKDKKRHAEQSQWFIFCDKIINLGVFWKHVNTLFLILTTENNLWKMYKTYQRRSIKHDDINICTVSWM